MNLLQAYRLTDSITNINAVDTTRYDVCRRNDISEASFYDKESFLRQITTRGADRALFSLADSTRERKDKEQMILFRHLKEGETGQAENLNADWIVLILVVAAFLMTVIRRSKKSTHPVYRFFLFRGINDPVSRDTGGIFHWQTTLLNLVSFLVISLYIYQAAKINDLLPEEFSGIVFWLGTLATIIIALTARHALCIITGNLSGQKEVFNEYLVGIYQSYHFTAVALFVLVILVSYTTIIPRDIFLTAGIISFGVVYLFRITRLLIIFLNRNISIFYLILYLCALEILPVSIIIRYFSGLV